MTKTHYTWESALEDVISPFLGRWEFETKDQDLAGCFVLESGYCQKNMVAKSAYGPNILLKKGSIVTGVIFCPYDLELIFFIDNNSSAWVSILELSISAEIH
jgi:hypothetical protein